MCACVGGDCITWPVCASHNIWIVEETAQLMSKAEAAQELAGNSKDDVPIKSSCQVLEGAQFSAVQCTLQDYDMAVDLKHHMLWMGQNEVLLWHPGASPWSSLPMLAKNEVTGDRSPGRGKQASGTKFEGCPWGLYRARTMAQTWREICQWLNTNADTLSKRLCMGGMRSLLEIQSSTSYRCCCHRWLKQCCPEGAARWQCGANSTGSDWLGIVPSGRTSLTTIRSTWA
jgi:hypothetical protein